MLVSPQKATDHCRNSPVARIGLTHPLGKLRELGSATLPIPWLPAQEPSDDKLAGNAIVMSLQPSLDPLAPASRTGVEFTGTRTVLEVSQEVTERWDFRNTYKASILRDGLRYNISASQYNVKMNYNLPSYLRLHRRSAYVGKLLNRFKREILATNLSEEEVEIVKQLRVSFGWYMCPSPNGTFHHWTDCFACPCRWWIIM